MADAIVYRVAYSDTVESIFQNGYSRKTAGSNDGSDYGNGVYCNVYLSQSEHGVRTGKYGDTIIKNKVIGGFSNFLIFDENVASKIYGASNLKDQVYQLFGEDAHIVWKDFELLIRIKHLSYTDGRNPGFRRTAEIPQQIMGGRLVHAPDGWNKSTIRRKYENLFLNHGIRGMLYTGGNDGTSVVVYNFSEVVPIAIKGPKDKDFKTMDYKAGHKVDSYREIGMNYKKVDTAIYLPNGKKYCLVTKFDGDLNIVDLDTKKEIIPFEGITSISSMSSADGSFQFETEVGGEKMFLKANPDGFWYDGDFIPFDSVNESKHIYKMLTEALFTAAGMEEDKTIYPPINRSKMGGAVSLYKVLPRESVESLTQNGEMDQFLGSNAGTAYGRCIYSWLSLKDAKEHYGIFGNAIMEYKLRGGFDKFLCFEPNSKQMVYGNSRISLRDQLYKIVGAENAEQILREIYDSEDSSNLRKLSRVALKYDIRGVIARYHGGHCIACFPYDFASCIPYRVSYDGGQTWKNIYNDSTEERFNNYVDTEWTFGDRGYKKISKGMKVNFKGQIYTFAIVQKTDGTDNIINVKTGEEIIPFDVYSVSSMGPNGDFTMDCEVGGEWQTLKANPEGFWYEGQFMTFAD